MALQEILAFCLQLGHLASRGIQVLWTRPKWQGFYVSIIEGLQYTSFPVMFDVY